MGSIQSFHEEKQAEEQLTFFPQEECEDDVYHVQCYHCARMIDPNESPVYCWNLGHQGQIFCCGGCDAEHRARYISLEEEANG
jgi:hypothetical protein